MGLDKTTQLLLLKTVTVRTGGIHEAQQLQLKMWPRLIKGVVKGTTTEVDAENKLVKFNLKTNSGFHLDYKTKRMFKEMTGWVRFILWDDTDVVFVAKNRVVYDTRGQ